VLVKVAQQEEKTRGGILIPVSAQKRPTSGEVVSLGDGRLNDGSVKPFYLKEGQTVSHDTVTQLSTAAGAAAAGPFQLVRVLQLLQLQPYNP